MGIFSAIALVIVVSNIHVVIPTRSLLILLLNCHKKSHNIDVQRYCYTMLMYTVFITGLTNVKFGLYTEGGLALGLKALLD